MKRKVLALLLTAAMTCTMFVGCGGKSQGGSKDSGKKDDQKTSQTITPKEGGKKGTLNLWAFTDEVPGMVKHYIEDHPDFPYKVTSTIIATTDGAYQPALDLSLIHI